MSQQKGFPAIEGMRSVFNFWIVSLHQHMLQKCFLALYNRIDLLEHLSTTIWSGVALGNGYQVDIFFMLSAFLFTWSLLKTKETSPTKSSSLVASLQWLLMFVIKRVLRLWPILIAILACAAVVNDYGARDLPSVLRTLTIPVYFDEIPQAAVPAWSNRVDIECCVALFFVIKALQWSNCLNTFTALLSIPVSLIPKALRFLSDPDTFSYMRLGANVLTTAIMVPQVRQEFYRDVLFKGQVAWFQSMDTIPRMTPLFYGEYVVNHQRWSPAFVGFAVAVALYGAYKRHEQRKKEAPATGIAATVLRVLYRVASFLLLLFSILLAALPVLMALSPPTEEVRTTMLANPPIEADFFVSVLGRTLNSCGWGYLLYRCMLPRGHVLRLNYLAAFFEQPVFQFTGRHTYCIYMLHFLVLHFVNFSVLSPPRMETLLGPWSAETLFAEFLVRLLAGYAITFALSVVIVRFVEQPMLHLLQRESKKFEAMLFGEAKKVV